MPVDALSRDQSRKLATGTLLTIDNTIDTTTGTVKLKATFDNADGALFPNQFVNVRMLVDTLQDVTVVPSSAIQRGTQGNFVYVVGADNTIALKPVRVGSRVDGYRVIREGLKGDETIVVNGLMRVRPGIKVDPKLTTLPATAVAAAN